MTQPFDPGPFDGSGGRPPQEPPRPGFAPAAPGPGPTGVPPESRPGAGAPPSAAADQTRRLAAACVDLVLSVLILYAGFILVMLANLAAVTLLQLPDNQVSLTVGMVLACAVALAATLCYHWLPVARRGQTPGKRIAGIRVVAAATGLPPSRGQAAGRAAVTGLLVLPCLLGHLVSGILVAADEAAGRSLPDRAARTRVVAA
ncbi:RDD family protein [Streptomonospora wellingtoniae]|uniref:RDD family protein n=1 Tax=Streptomonospora wellingtoniae TaxID=3075544 RepID=A0ABU2KX11_9ACTN|nr:RDD family protein [Streptomonospora sp. DSM 45055]MDT0303780.1 RDD family protein [Streptomonospora sp. DSM 45055]